MASFPTSHDVLSFALDAQADYDPSEALIIDAHEPSRVLNGAQLRLLIHTFIAGFKAHGIKQGDCVLVNLRNNVRFPPSVVTCHFTRSHLAHSNIPQVLYTAIFLAITGAGGVYIGASPHSVPHELDHVVRLGRPVLILTEPDALPTTLSVSKKNGISPHQLFLLDEAALNATIAFAQSHKQCSPASALTDNSTTSAETCPFLSLLAHGSANPLCIPELETANSTPAALYSTSGTTGLPKAAVFSHGALIAGHISAAANPPPYKVRRLVCLPFYHLFASFWSHLFPLRYGSPLYIAREFQLPIFLDMIRQHGISDTHVVPAIVHSVNQAPASLDPRSALTSLRYVGVSGAPIDRACMADFQTLLHSDACAGQIWGMTETGPVFQNRYPARGCRAEQADLGGIGPILPGWEAKLLTYVEAGSGENEDQQPAQQQPVEVVDAAGPPGRLYVRGAGGWFSTGDVAYVNKRGEYFIVGRTKELIKVRGASVSPAEIEAVLLKHPLIADAAVTGIKLPGGTEEAPRAYVVRSGDASGKLTVNEVYEFAQQRLASYKSLDGGVCFVESIPRTVSGKVQRGKLAGMNERRDALEGLLKKMKGGG
ncbi:uncharacterized protein ATNIH1004_002237 [Aspergillus tanneri]|uniref:Uncharacterized protein n=1 Tax=Aspergillus tanneri TaxID=1220188 RepID=A0A5M9MUE7_9EURO|nr:uncharacterized protein ATNIH1004_002237 [Aspergillus tanneri]KAA8649566.1 hypothetical protein ATNIH1004_002237 [Aspergillus tanneri]